MLDPADIVRFSDTPAPEGASPWVGGAAPARDLEIVPPDPAWPERFAALETRIRAALGERVLALEHVGSTSVPGFAAKPIIDIDITVADGADEPAYVPALEAAGFTLRVREPWWYGHRLLGADDPRAFRARVVSGHPRTRRSRDLPRLAPRPPGRPGGVRRCQARRGGGGERARRGHDVVQRPQAGRDPRDLRPRVPRGRASRVSRAGTRLP